jgi:hypothetical protein
VISKSYQIYSAAMQNSKIKIFPLYLVIVNIKFSELNLF